MTKFEQYVLNKITTDKTCATQFLKESIEVFSHQLKMVHFGIKEVFNKNLPFTFTAIVNESHLSENDIKVISETPILSIPKDKEEESDFQYCINRIKEDFKYKELEKVANLILKDIKEGKDINSLLESIMARTGAISNKDGEIQCLNPEDLMNELDDWMDDIEKGKITPSIKSDLRELNYATGGFQYGDLVLLKGFTGSGKTAMALHLAKCFGITQKVETAYFNMEMTNKQLGGRLISSVSNHEDIYWHNLLKQETYLNPILKKEIQETKTTIKNSKLRLININFPTLNQVESLVREYKERYGTKVFFLDYLQRMKLPSGKKDSWEQIMDVVKGIKTLAKSLNVIIFCLVQVKTDGTTAGASFVDWEADLAFWIRKPSEDEMKKFCIEEFSLSKITRVLEFTKQRMGAESLVKPIHFYGKKLQFFNTSKTVFKEKEYTESLK